MPTPEERVSLRRKKLLNLRRGVRGGVFGLGYGVSAFGYPLGTIPGVQTAPTDPPISPDQFGDQGSVTTTDTGSTGTDSSAGSAGDSGGGAAS